MKLGRFDGKVAIVTGGSSGIGRATALAFAREGAKVAITFHTNAKGGEETVRLIKAGGEAICMQMDVSKADDVKAMVEKTIEVYSRLDYAFNNAGMYSGASILDITEDDWDAILDVNLKGIWLCMKYEIPEMLKQGSGVIVNTSSNAGLTFRPMSSLPVYRASKHALISLSKSAAAAYRKLGIRVNVVCPGFIHTPMLEHSIQHKVFNKEHIETLESEGLVGEPADIAKAVVWLCSDAASFINGHALVIDGGLMIS